MPEPPSATARFASQLGRGIDERFPGTLFDRASGRRASMVAV